MTQRDDRHNGIGASKTRSVLKLETHLLPIELVGYARLYNETTGLAWRAANQQEGDSPPPLDTLPDLERACHAAERDILDTVREEHPEAIEQVIAERGL